MMNRDINPFRPVRYKRSAAAESTHNRMLLYTADYLHRSNFFVLADHIGWTYGCPIEQNGYRPDISATKDGVTYLIEIETLDSYRKEHCMSQLRAFCKTGFETHVILPGDYLGQGIAVSNLRYLLAKNKISAHVGTCTLNDGHVKFNVS